MNIDCRSEPAQSITCVLTKDGSLNTLSMHFSVQSSLHSAAFSGPVRVPPSFFLEQRLAIVIIVHYRIRNAIQYKDILHKITFRNPSGHWNKIKIMVPEFLFNHHFAVVCSSLRLFNSVPGKIGFVKMWKKRFRAFVSWITRHFIEIVFYNNPSYYPILIGSRPMVY